MSHPTSDERYAAAAQTAHTDGDKTTELDIRACADIRILLNTAGESGQWSDALWEIESRIARWYTDRAAATPT